MIQVPGAFPKGKLVNRVRDHRVPNVETRVAPVASTARLILIAKTLAGSAGGIGDGVRPHVLRLQQPAARKAALQRDLKRIEVVVAMIRLQSERSKLR